MNSLGIYFIAVTVCAFSSEATSNERVKRQIYYADIPIKPQTSRSRPEEKDNVQRTGHLPLEPHYPIGGASNQEAFDANFPDQQDPFNHEAPQFATANYFEGPFDDERREGHSMTIEIKPHIRNPEHKPVFKALSKAEPSLSISDIHHGQKQPPHKENAIPGIAGKDYPIYREIPHTNFLCSDVPFRPGMYANPETGCQGYHVCNDDRHGPQGASFLCTNGTIFNQETFSCDWWYNVNCQDALSFYGLNSDPKFNPYYQKPYEEQNAYKPEESFVFDHSHNNGRVFTALSEQSPVLEGPYEPVEFHHEDTKIRPVHDAHFGEQTILEPNNRIHSFGPFLFHNNKSSITNSHPHSTHDFHQSSYAFEQSPTGTNQEPIINRGPQRGIQEEPIAFEFHPSSVQQFSSSGIRQSQLKELELTPSTYTFDSSFGSNQFPITNRGSEHAETVSHDIHGQNRFNFQPSSSYAFDQDPFGTNHSPFTKNILHHSDTRLSGQNTFFGDHTVGQTTRHVIGESNVPIKEPTVKSTRHRYLKNTQRQRTPEQPQTFLPETHSAGFSFQPSVGFPFKPSQVSMDLRPKHDHPAIQRTRSSPSHIPMTLGSGRHDQNDQAAYFADLQPHPYMDDDLQPHPDMDYDLQPNPDMDYEWGMKLK